MQPSGLVRYSLHVISTSSGLGVETVTFWQPTRTSKLGLKVQSRGFPWMVEAAEVLGTCISIS
jgi:hypothetical protein